MGTIAEKLTYLNTTKIKLRDSLNKFGSSILSTDTFRSYDTKLNEIYDKLPKVTATGQGLTISNVQNGLLDDFKMNGVDLEQDTTTGKNLLNISDITSGNGIKNNNNKSITLNGNITSTSFTLTNPITLKANATYIMSLTNNDTNAGDSTFILRNGNTNKMSIYFKNLVSNAPFTPTEDIIIDTLRIYNSGVTFNNYTFSIQLEEGSSSTNFEPYTNGASPNPDYPQDIKVVEGRQVITDKGKNLFTLDNQLLALGNVRQSGNNQKFTLTGFGTNEAFIYKVGLIKDFVGKTLTFKCDYTTTSNLSNEQLGLIYCDNDGSNRNNLSLFSKDNNTMTTTYTIPSSIDGNLTLAVRLYGTGSVNNSSTTYMNVQLEENSTATDYEPYYEPVSYNIDLHGKNEFDGEYEDGYYNMNGTKSSTQDPYGRRSTNLNEIKPNTNYIISINNNVISEAIRVFFYDANRGFISTESISNGTFTTSAECYYVSWHSSSLKQNYPDGIPNMMIEQGQTVTTYEDYYDYKLAKIPNTDYKNKIYKNNGNWYFEKNIEKIILDGIVNLFLTKTGNAGNVYTINQLNDLKSTSSNDEIVNAISNYFIADAYSNLGNLDNVIVEYRGSQVIRFKFGVNSSITTLNLANEWLQNNNVLLYYTLATPVTTQITNATLINQLEAISVHTGTNIITISNDNNIIPEIEITRLKELEKLA